MQQPMQNQQAYMPAPAYHPQQGNMPVQGGPTQIVNTPQGAFYMDIRTGQLLGPVQQQGVMQNVHQTHGQMRHQAVAPYHASHNQQGFNMGAATSNMDLEQPADNRYGNANSLIKQRKEPVVEVVATPVPPVVERPKVKSRLAMVNYKPAYHNKPFTKDDISQYEESLIGPSLEHLIYGLIDTAHQQDNDSLVCVQSGIVVHKFFNTSTIDYETDLFQENIEFIYKALKRLLPEVRTQSNLVYFQAYNDWLTSCVNTFLSVKLEDTQIDSFADDFNDLIKYLIQSHEDVRDMLLDFMNEILAQARLDVEAIRNEDESGEVNIPSTESIVPDRVNLAYVKLHSAEIGDDTSQTGLRVDTKLMVSLQAVIDEVEFILITLDRRVYRVTSKVGDTISIRCISD